jgi:hypothetical protein
MSFKVGDYVKTRNGVVLKIESVRFVARDVHAILYEEDFQLIPATSDEIIEFNNYKIRKIERQIKELTTALEAEKAKLK